jgi:hypothetical protein
VHSASAASLPRHAFVFVCQAGELELKALLLASSLRRNLQADHELIAAVPTPAQCWGEIAAETRVLLQQLRVRIVPIANPIDPDYPIGNKLACLDVGASAGKICFLDSDILCLRELGDPACLRVPFAAKPADLRTFAAAAAAWQPLYAAAGVELPRLRLPTTVSGEFGLPYFNSGVVCVDASLNFGATWIECARAVNADLLAREQRHWLDQVALPIAMHKRGLRYAALDERFNYPAHLKPLGVQLPVFCHYHWPRVIAREPRLRDFVRTLAREHAHIADLMRSRHDWSGLLEGGDDAPNRSAAAARAAEATALSNSAAAAGDASPRVILAGMPGCGVAMIAAAHARAGAHVIDESSPRAATLVEQPVPWELAAAMHEAGAGAAANGAASILAGEIAVLCRLGALRRVLPDARVILCVRDPQATLRRWNALAPDEFARWLSAATGVAERWLPRADTDALRAIAALDDGAERRAACWWWFAQRLLEQAHGARILRDDELDALAAALASGDGVASIPACDQTETAALPELSEAELQAIDAICLQAAAELGVGV